MLGELDNFDMDKIIAGFNALYKKSSPSRLEARGRGYIPKILYTLILAHCTKKVNTSTPILPLLASKTLKKSQKTLAKSAKLR